MGESLDSLTIDINAYCNLRCTFCYQDLNGAHMTKSAILAIVEQHPDAPSVEIGGGEPLMHREIIPLMKDISARGKRIHIATNATYLPQGMLTLEDEVREMTTMQVSLHAANPELF